MIVAIDTNCVVEWSSRKTDHPPRQRLEHLFATVSALGGRIIIATPCLAEFLVKTDAASRGWLDGLERRKAIIVAPFDRRAAFECALLDKAAIGAGDKRAGRKDSWQRIKIDRQIIAVARVHQATLVISDDDGLCGTARAVGIEAKCVSDLELPASALQTKLEFDDDSQRPARAVAD